MTNLNNEGLYFISMSVFGIVGGVRGVYWMAFDGITASAVLLAAGCLAILVGVGYQWRTPSADVPGRFAWVAAFGALLYIGGAAVGLLW